MVRICIKKKNIYIYIYIYKKNIWEHIWEKGPIGNRSHHVGFILELCSKYEIFS